MPRLSDFGPCWQAPGVQGWLGEGYWYHDLAGVRQMLNFKGSTRVAKTTTLGPNKGNMPVEDKCPWQPISRFPECIYVDPLSARTLNAISLTGPGASELIRHGLLKDKKPFMISFMSVAKDEKVRVEEFEEFTRRVIEALPQPDRIPMAFQENESCPNTGLDPDHLIHEATTKLDRADRLRELGINIIVKLNILAPIEAAKKIAEHRNCAALCVTNALPFGSFPDRIDWKKLFPNGSPLKEFGNGGYSGPELLELVPEWVVNARLAGIEKPMNVGGGIRKAKHVRLIVERAKLKPRHDSIFFASAAMARPWNVRSIIREAHQLLG